MIAAHHLGVDVDHVTVFAVAVVFLCVCVGFYIAGINKPR